MKAELVHEVLNLWKSAWRKSEESTDLGLSGRVLRKHQSFRLLASAAHDPLVGFRMLKRLRSRWSSPSAFKTGRNEKSNTLVMDGVSRNEKAVLSYVECMLGEEVGHFISRDDLPCDRGSRWPLSFWRFALAAAVGCIGSRERFHKALGIYTVAELVALLEYVEDNEVENVVDFAPYLVDSNLLYLLLKKRGIRTMKVPSPGPLGTHNHILLADEVAISTPYHAFEMDRFKETFRVKRAVNWIPERTQNYIDRYRKNRPETATGTIGYYSHGSWVRASAGHTSDGLGLHDKEEELLQYLGEVLNRRPEWNLIIFPHPREKKPDMLDQTRAYYDRHLHGVTFEISLDDRPTSLQFERAEVGVAVFSTIIYERLFSGYRTLIFQRKGDSFPDPATSLSSIAVHDGDGIEVQFERWMGSQDRLFFEDNQIEGYHWTSYEMPDDLPVTL